MKKLEHHGVDRRADDIVDAEFVEVSPGRQDRPIHKSSVIDELKSVVGFVLKVVGVLALLLLIVLVFNFPDEPAPSRAETAASWLTLAAEPASIEDIDVVQKLPPLDRLIRRGEVRACGHPIVFDGIKSKLFDSTTPEAVGLTAKDFVTAWSRIELRLTEATVARADPATHQLSCLANLRYSAVEPISYQLRPVTDAAFQPELRVDLPRGIAERVFADQIESNGASERDDAAGEVRR